MKDPTIAGKRKYFISSNLSAKGSADASEIRALEESTIDECNVIGSLTESGTHMPAIDIDFPCKLIPSSTEGCFHLYIDVECDGEKYFAMLDAMAEAGVIQVKWAEASRIRGASTLRPPWIKKGE